MYFLVSNSLKLNVDLTIEKFYFTPFTSTWVWTGRIKYEKCYYH